MYGFCLSIRKWMCTTKDIVNSNIIYFLCISIVTTSQDTPWLASCHTIWEPLPCAMHFSKPFTGLSQGDKVSNQIKPAVYWRVKELSHGCIRFVKQSTAECCWCNSIVESDSSPTLTTPATLTMTLFIVHSYDIPVWWVQLKASR